MRDLDFSFEQSPWEALLNTKHPGETVSAVNLLTLLEEEDEDGVEEAFQLLDEKNLILEIQELPKTPGQGEAAARLHREEILAKNGLKITDFEETDPLRLYLEEVDRISADADEEALALKCAQGNQNAIEQLTNAGLRRVVALAAEYAGYGVLLLDLIQEGSLGLWQAIQNYRLGDYGAFRDYRIRNAMAKAIAMQARSNGIGQKMRNAMEDFRAVDERLLTDLGRNPTMEEIALELHMSAEEAASVKKMMEDARLLQMAVKPREPEEAVPEEEDQAVEDTAYFQARQRILELLSVLNEEDAKLLTLRFGLEKGLPLSPEETGKILGISVAEVISREAKALAQLRSEK